jgi:Est1 DNA/RNA binding domain/Telomerase activating protein Est1
MATSQQPNPFARCCDLQHLALELESRLEKAIAAAKDNAKTNPKNVALENVDHLRVRLCEVLSNIILIHPVFAVQKQCWKRLWSHTFYARIQTYRADLAKFEQRIKKSKDTDADKLALAKKQWKATRTAFAKFLQETIHMYEFIYKNYTQERFMPFMVQMADTKPGSAGSGSLATALQPHQQSLQSSASSRDEGADRVPTTLDVIQNGIIPGLYQISISLGDLYRYMASDAKEDHYFSQAQSYYQVASHYYPLCGHPQNQLAVVTQLKAVANQVGPVATSTESSADNHAKQSNHSAASTTSVKSQPSSQPQSAVALYYYARAILTGEPFPTARTNVQRLFLENRRFCTAENTSGNPGQSTLRSKAANHSKVNKTLLSRSFWIHFVDIQYRHFLGTLPSEPTPLQRHQGDKSLTVFDELHGRVLADNVDQFRCLLENSGVSDALLFKLVAILAFTEFETASGMSESYGNLNRRQQHVQNHDRGESRQRQHIQMLTTLSAQISTFKYGAVLAQRCLHLLMKSATTPATAGKSASSQSQFPSMRLLTPLLLLTEYLAESHARRSREDDTGDIARDAVNEFTEQAIIFNSAQELFWRVVVDVWTQLHKISEDFDCESSNSVDGNNQANQPTPSEDHTIKDYQQFRGFLPFDTFISHQAPPLNDGYVSEREAMSIVTSFTQGGDVKSTASADGSSANDSSFLLPSGGRTIGVGASIVLAPSSTSSSIKNSNNWDENCRNLRRMVLVGQQMALSGSSMSHPHIHLLGQGKWSWSTKEKDPVVQSLSQREGTDDSGDMIMTPVNNENDDAPPAREDTASTIGIGTEPEKDLAVASHKAVPASSTLMFVPSQDGHNLLVPAVFGPNASFESPQNLVSAMDVDPFVSTDAGRIEQSGAASPARLAPAPPIAEMDPVPVIASHLLPNALPEPPGLLSRLSALANDQPIVASAAKMAPPPGFNADTGSMICEETVAIGDLLRSAALPSTMNPFAGALEHFAGGTNDGSSSSHLYSSELDQATFPLFGLPVEGSEHAFAASENMVTDDGASMLIAGLLSSLWEDKNQSTMNPFAS